jgi:hypothetical protein
VIVLLANKVGEVINMQMKKAEQLRKQWESKGNPLCDHPVLDKEYIEGFDTGDRVCTTCGQCFAPSELEQEPKTYRWRPKSK